MTILVQIISATSSTVHVNTASWNNSNGCSSSVVNSESNIRSALNTFMDEKYGVQRENVDCGGKGWTRMALLNMTDTNSRCPSTWRLHQSPVRGCGRSSSTAHTCDSAYFNNARLSYNRVCGRIIAYQKGHNDAFYAYTANIARTIETAYSAGLLVTHGPDGSRRHIWTFSSALYKQRTVPSNSTCPCTSPNQPWTFNFPPFVGNNYFCDSGNPGPGFSSTTLYSQDPLWDGKGCPSGTTCCQLNNPPWFNVALPQTTRDDIEVRLCVTEGSEDVIVSLIELYVA